MSNINTITALMPTKIGNAIRYVFERMEIAEEEIARLFPTREQEPEGIFMAVKPGEAFDGMANWLYRAHVRELCERGAVPGLGAKGYEPATDAEISIHLHHTSLAAPLRPEYAHVYGVAFQRAAGRANADFDFDVPGAELYAGHADETLIELARKLRTPGRGQA